MARAMEWNIMYGIRNMDMDIEMEMVMDMDMVMAMVMIEAFTGSTFTKSFNLDVEKKQRKKDEKASLPFFLHHYM